MEELPKDCAWCGGEPTRFFESRWHLKRILGLCDEHAEERAAGLKHAEYKEITNG